MNHQIEVEAGSFDGRRFRVKDTVFRETIEAAVQVRLVIWIPVGECEILAHPIDDDGVEVETNENWTWPLLQKKCASEEEAKTELSSMCCDFLDWVRKNDQCLLDRIDTMLAEHVLR